MKPSIFKILAVVLLFQIIKQTISQEVPLLSNVIGRSKIPLNGKWNYIIDVQEVGYYDYRMEVLKNGFFMNQKPKSPDELIEYDFDLAPKMQIPSDWNTQSELLFFYEGTVWFKRSFNYTKIPDKKVILYFCAINYEAIVYLNGKIIGKHIGGYTPFNYDVTEYINDGDNFLIIKVDNKRNRDNIPTNIFDWWNYGGIIRDVALVETNKVYVQNYTIYLKNRKVNEVQFRVQLNSKVANKEIEINIPEFNFVQKYKTNNEGLMIESKVLNDLVLWTPENPKLYTIIITLDGEEILDQIGFRTIETKDKSILLNGKPIFLRGISIHDEMPNGGGRIHKLEDILMLLDWVSDLGCNFVRLAHYPHNEYMVKEAEKKGLLIWEEIPVYWTISWDNIDTFNNAKRQLTDLIYRDINRASVIVWSIANETPPSKSRDNFLSKLAIHAKSIDNTRLISMAMEVTSSSENYTNILNDNMNEFVDILSINEYIGWYRDVYTIDKMKWIIPYNKPVIISEFGGGAKYGYHGGNYTRWTEEFQENLYKHNLNMINQIDGLIGLTPWILKDFRSPRRVLNDIQDYYNRKGVVSDTGDKKLAFYVLKQFYEKKKKEYE